MRTAVAALLVLASISLSGCSDSLSATTASSAAPSVAASIDPSVRAKLPPKVAAAGKVIVGTDPTYAPNEFLDADGHTVVGASAEVLAAAMGRLGLRVEWAPSPFDGVVAGVEAGRYDLAMSSLTINPDRLRQGTMVSYFTAGTRWAVASGNPRGFAVGDAYCGHSVAVQTGTYQEQELLPTMRSTCPADRPLTVLSFQSQAEATASLVAGKADAMVADSPVIDYATKQSNGKVTAASGVEGSAPYGYFLPKDQQAFAGAIADALRALQADGTYDSILKKWGVEAGAIGSPEVNPKVG